MSRRRRAASAQAQAWALAAARATGLVSMLVAAGCQRPEPPRGQPGADGSATTAHQALLRAQEWSDPAASSCG